MTSQGTKSPGKRGPKFRKTDRESVIARCVQLDHIGWQAFEIAEELRISASTVYQYLSLQRKRWRESANADYAEMVGEVMSVLRWVRKEAWAAWERSKLDKESHTVEKTPQVVKLLGKDKKEPAFKTVQRLKEIMTKEGRLPAAEYLNIFIKTWTIQCELYGIDAEKAPVNLLQINMGGVAAAGFDWEPLTERRGVTDPAAQAIAALPPPKVVDAEVVDGPAAP